MPKVTVLYSVGGYIRREYDIPEEIASLTKNEIVDYLVMNDVDPTSIRDNSEEDVEQVYVENA